MFSISFQNTSSIDVGFCLFTEHRETNKLPLNLSLWLSHIVFLCSELPDIDNHLVGVWWSSYHRLFCLPVLLLQMRELRVSVQRAEVNLVWPNRNTIMKPCRPPQHYPEGLGCWTFASVLSKILPLVLLSFGDLKMSATHTLCSFFRPN